MNIINEPASLILITIALGVKPSDTWGPSVRCWSFAPGRISLVGFEAFAGAGEPRRYGGFPMVVPMAMVGSFHGKSHENMDETLR